MSWRRRHASLPQPVFPPTFRAFVGCVALPRRAVRLVADHGTWAAWIVLYLGSCRKACRLMRRILKGMPYLTSRSFGLGRCTHLYHSQLLLRILNACAHRFIIFPRHDTRTRHNSAINFRSERVLRFDRKTLYLKVKDFCDICLLRTHTRTYTGNHRKPACRVMGPPTLY